MPAPTSREDDRLKLIREKLLKELGVEPDSVHEVAHAPLTPGGVLIETAAGKMLISVGPEGVTVSSVGEAEDFSAWDAWQSLPHALSTAQPTLRELVGEVGCEPWLKERYEALAGVGRPFEMVASVGAMARLWYMPGAGMTPEPDPSTVGARWVRSLPAREIDAVERFAMERAGELREQLDAGQESERTTEEVRAILHERDALESVLAMLWLAGDGKRLGRELAATDDTATVVLSELPISEEIERDPLLVAVALAEPDSWWGCLPNE